MEKRVRFDFEIEFTNGGGMSGEDFRLDIVDDAMDDKALGDRLVTDLQLLMVGKVRISNKQIIVEPHKRKQHDVLPEGDQLIDLSHVIEDGLVTYKGLPAPLICDFLTREDSRKLYGPGTEFQIGKIEMVSNTGTYIDCPFHRFEHGDDTSQVMLERVAELEGVVIHSPHGTRLAISEEQLKGYEIRSRAVLIHTGWDENWNTEKYYEGHPYLTKGAAEFLRDSGVKLVGIDSHNIDNVADKLRPVHTTLLGSGILIVEHMCNLSALPDEGFKFSAVPPKFKGVGTFPVRAMARVYR